MAVFGFPPPPQVEPNTDFDGLVRWARQFVAWGSRIMQGKTTNLGEVTLTANDTTTTVTDVRCTTGSLILFTPLTANAAAIAEPYVLSANCRKGSFVITHASDANNDLTFRYGLWG